MKATINPELHAGGKGNPGEMRPFLSFGGKQFGGWFLACPGCGQVGVVRVDAKDHPSWRITEGASDQIETVTLSPSLNFTVCCGWHGYLTKGEFKLA